MKQIYPAKFFFAQICVSFLFFFIHSNIYADDSESSFREYYREQIGAPKTAPYRDTDLYIFGKKFCEKENLRCYRYHMRYIANKDNILAPFIYTSNGDMLVVGAEKAVNSRGFVFRLNDKNEILWKKIFSKKGHLAINGASTIETADAGFLVYMLAYVKPSHMGKTWILKLNKHGEVQWEKLYRGSGGIDTPHASELWMTKKGHLKMTGHIYPKPRDPAMAWESEMDKNGKVLYDLTKGEAYKKESKFDAKYPFLVE